MVGLRGVQLLLLTLALALAQSKGRQPVRIVNVSSKMHELAGGVDVDDPHFEARGAFSSLAAYNRSKLCQVRLALVGHALGMINEFGPGLCT